MAQHVLLTPLYCLSNTDATRSSVGFKPRSDIENTTSPAQAIRHLFRLLQAFDTPRDNQPVCPSFRTLLAWSPPAPVMNGATRSRFAGSHVMRRGWCLARWLHPANFLGFSPSPSRFSAAQDSKTAHLPLQDFNTTGLADLWSATRITLRKHLLEVPYLLKLYSEACGLRHTRPGAPVLPCSPIASQQSQQPAARHRLYRHRHPLGRTDYLHSHRQEHRGISSARPCPCRPTLSYGLGSKVALQPPAPRCETKQSSISWKPNDC